MRKIGLLVPAILSAVLLWASFPPLGETANIAVALVPLLVVARLCSPKRSAWTWFACGMLFWTVTLSWKATKGATHYEVFLYDDAKEDFRLYGLSGYLQMTVKNLSPNSAYRFKVRPFRLDKGKYAAGEMSGELSETTDTNGLPHTEWQAVKAYNAALNAAKSGGSYRLTQKKTVKTTKHSVSRAAFDGTADNLMRLFSGSRTRRYTLKNGKTADGDTALSLLPPFGKTLALTPNDLKSFTAEKKEGGGYVLTLTLNEDVSLFENGKTSRPQVLSKATDYLRFEKLDTTPIRLTSGKVFM